MTKKQIEKTDQETNFDFLKAWANNSNVNRSFEELKQMFEKIQDLVKAKFPDYVDSKVFSITRQRLYAELKASLKSNSAVWLINPLFNSIPFDFGTPHYNRNLEEYKKNPRKAIEQGLVKVTKNPAGNQEIVTPVEERDKKTKGKPIQAPAYLGNIGGIAMPYKAFEDDKWESLKLFNMTIFNPFANPTDENYLFDKFDVNSWYKIKLTNKTPANISDHYEFNFTSSSKFDQETDEVDKLTPDEIKEYFIDHFRTLGELKEWHDSNAEFSEDGTSSNNYDIVLTEGQIIEIEKGDESNSHRLSIDDENSLGFGTEETKFDDITIWYDSKKPLNFGKYSRVLVFGKTKRTLKKDLITQEYSSEWGNIQIAALGFFVTQFEPPEIEDENAGDTKESVTIDESKNEGVNNDDNNSNNNGKW